MAKLLYFENDSYILIHLILRYSMLVELQQKWE